jgi:hypothetical protein
VPFSLPLTPEQQREDIANDIAHGMGAAHAVSVVFAQDDGGVWCAGDEIECVMIDQHIAQQVETRFFSSQNPFCIFLQNDDPYL